MEHHNTQRGSLNLHDAMIQFKQIYLLKANNRLGKSHE